jgi:TolB-like protein
LKIVSMVASTALLCVLIACASAPPPGATKIQQEAQILPQEEKKVTPRFHELEECLEYVWTALDSELYNLRQTNQFSAGVSGGGSMSESRPLTAEEQVQQHAQDALDELDKEIAKQEGRSYTEAQQPVAVTSGESYTTGESSNMGGARPPSGKPMVIAVADFVNDNGEVSKLGRYIADKLTPYFARSRQFSVLERNLINKVIEEQQFQVSAFVDESSTQEFGKILGAETIISGKISELADMFYVNARAVGVARGNLMVSIDAEIDRSGRLVALYNAPLPKPKKEPSKPRIFRAKGIGVPSKKQTNPTLARTLAARAAQADAMRNLAQEIQGAQIDSETTVKDYMTESDNVSIGVNSFLRGARMIDKKEMPDGAVEVEMEVEVPGEFFDSLQR